METANHLKKDGRHRAQVKDIVIVLDGENTCITDIIRAIINPQEVRDDHPSPVTAIGFIDGSQFREIVKIMEKDKLPTQ